MTLILIISPESWEAHSVSKHHYARELARRGHRVLFFGPPEAGSLRLDLVTTPGPGRLEVLRGRAVAPALRLMPPVFRRFLEARWLGAVERLAGEMIEVVWLFENSRFFDMTFAGERLKIYQQVDLDQVFHPLRAAASADIAIALSSPIENRIAGSARHLLRLTHGCLPNSAGHSEPPSLDDTFGRYQINAVMTGNLSIEYLDHELLADLVVAHPDVGFHFVGGYIIGQGLNARVSNAPNAIFWGHHPAGALPAFLNRADVLLVAYRAKEHLDQLANPHKMMEYLAAGRCILASRTLEYEGRPDLVETALNQTAYKARFAAIVTKPSAFNTPDMVSRRRAFAADNTYPRQLDRIAEALGSRGPLIS